MPKIVWETQKVTIKFLSRIHFPSEYEQRFDVSGVLAKRRFSKEEKGP